MWRVLLGLLDYDWSVEVLPVPMRPAAAGGGGPRRRTGAPVLFVADAAGGLDAPPALAGGALPVRAVGAPAVTGGGAPRLVEGAAAGACGGAGASNEVRRCG